MTDLAKKEQERRRAILIVIKNAIQKMIEDGWHVLKAEDGNYINIRNLYDDLENFLYGTDIVWLPYLVSIEEVEYYQRVYRWVKKLYDKRFEIMLADN